MHNLYCLIIMIISLKFLKTIIILIDLRVVDTEKTTNDERNKARKILVGEEETSLRTDDDFAAERNYK